MYFGACHCVVVSEETDGDDTDGHPEKSKMVTGKSRIRPDGRYVHTYLNVFICVTVSCRNQR